MASYTIAPDGQSITCRFCGRTSFHPDDVKHLYCGNCHIFHPDQAAIPEDFFQQLEGLRSFRQAWALFTNQENGPTS